MLHLILVEPSGDDWVVRSDQITSDMTFRSGRQAEDAAKRLGTQIVDAGGQAEILIHLRGGALAGRFICALTSTCDSHHVRQSGPVSIALELAL